MKVKLEIKTEKSEISLALLGGIKTNLDHDLKYETEFMKLEAQEIDTDAVYLVGVVNDKKLVLQPATIYKLQRTLKSEPIQIEQDRTNVQQTATSLGEAFGSAKTKKLMRAKERNKVDVSTFGNTANFITQAVEESGATEHVMEEAKILPSYCLLSEKPKNVYPFDTLVGSMLIPLQEIAETIDMMDEEELKTKFPGIIPLCLSGILKEVEKKTVNQEHLVLFLFIHYMMQIHKEKTRTQTPDKLIKKLGCSFAIAKSILQRFFDQIDSGGGKFKYGYTDRTKTSSIMHAVVALLHICDFRVDISKSCRELTVPKKNLVTYFINCGCKIEGKVRNDAFAVLKAPLRLPE